MLTLWLFLFNQNIFDCNLNDVFGGFRSKTAKRTESSGHSPGEKGGSWGLGIGEAYRVPWNHCRIGRSYNSICELRLCIYIRTYVDHVQVACWNTPGPVPDSDISFCIPPAPICSAISISTSTFSSVQFGFVSIFDNNKYWKIKRNLMSTKLPRPMPEGPSNRNIESFLGWPEALQKWACRSWRKAATPTTPPNATKTKKKKTWNQIKQFSSAFVRDNSREKANNSAS